MGESSINEAILKSMVSDSLDLVGEQNQRLQHTAHLLHECIAIIKEYEQTIKILNEVIDHKDETISTLDAHISLLKSIAIREQQLRHAHG